MQNWVKFRFFAPFLLGGTFRKWAKQCFFWDWSHVMWKSFTNVSWRTSKKVCWQMKK